jgi:hypothetical protein
VADRIGEDPEPIAVRLGVVSLQRGAQGHHPAVLGLEVVDLEVQVELLGVLTRRPLRRP